MSNPEKYISEVKELINSYGLEAFAKVLGKTERGIQYWLTEDNPKKPGPKTQQKIHELFMQHKAGNGLLRQEQPKSGDKSEILDIMRDRIKELKEDRERLWKNLEFSLAGLHLGQKSILAHVSTILEKDDERDSAGNKRKEQSLKDETGKRIADKISGISQMDTSHNR